MQRRAAASASLPPGRYKGPAPSAHFLRHQAPRMYRAAVSTRFCFLNRVKLAAGYGL